MLAYKTAHDAYVAGQVIACELQSNKELAAAAVKARLILSVAYPTPMWHGSV